MSRKQPKVLIVARLSRLNEVSESIERQIEDCRAVCDRNGWEVLGVAQDVNVSAGKTSPFERPELREWIGDGGEDPGRAHEIDVILFWRVDRIVRNMVDLWKLVIWSDDYGIRLKSATEDHFDTGSTLGKAIASLVASFAEMELEAIRERVTSDKQHRLSEGAFVGGVPVWGYTPYRDETAGMMKLRQDPDQVRQIRFVVDGLFEGKSLNQLARELTDAGELTSRDMNRKRRLKAGEKFVPRYPRWSSVTIKKALQNPAMMGYAVQSPIVRDEDGQIVRDRRGEKQYGDPVVVRDASGNPIMRGEPIVSPDEFAKIQQEIQNRSRKQQVHSRSDSLLLGVMHCGVCGRKAYRQRHGKYGYYTCSSYQAGKKCCDRSVMTSADWMDERFTDVVLGLFGQAERAERQWDQGEEYEDEILNLERRIREQSNALNNFHAGDAAFDTILNNIRKSQDRLNELRARGTRRAGWVWVPTGETLAQWWEKATTKQRNEWIKQADIQLYYRNLPDRRRGEQPEFDLVFRTLELVARGLSSESMPGFIGAWGGIAPHGEQLIYQERRNDNGDYTVRTIMRPALEDDSDQPFMIDELPEPDEEITFDQIKQKD